MKFIITTNFMIESKSYPENIEKLKVAELFEFALTFKPKLYGTIHAITENNKCYETPNGECIAINCEKHGENEHMKFISDLLKGEENAKSGI